MKYLIQLISSICFTFSFISATIHPPSISGHCDGRSINVCDNACLYRTGPLEYTIDLVAEDKETPECPKKNHVILQGATGYYAENTKYDLILDEFKTFLTVHINEKINTFQYRRWNNEKIHFFDLCYKLTHSQMKKKKKSYISRMLVKNLPADHDKWPALSCKINLLQDFLSQYNNLYIFKPATLLLNEEICEAWIELETKLEKFYKLESHASSTAEVFRIQHFFYKNLEDVPKYFKDHIDKIEYIYLTKLVKWGDQMIRFIIINIPYPENIRVPAPCTSLCQTLQWEFTNLYINCCSENEQEDSHREGYFFFRKNQRGKVNTFNSIEFDAKEKFHSIVINVNEKEIVWESNPHLVPMMPGMKKPNDKTPNRYFCLQKKMYAYEYSKIEVQETDSSYFLRRSKNKCQFRIPITSFHDSENRKVYRSGFIVQFDASNEGITNRMKNAERKIVSSSFSKIKKLKYVFIEEEEKEEESNNNEDENTVKPSEIEPDELNANPYKGINITTKKGDHVWFFELFRHIPLVPEENGLCTKHSILPHAEHHIRSTKEEIDIFDYNVHKPYLCKHDNNDVEEFHSMENINNKFEEALAEDVYEYKKYMWAEKYVRPFLMVPFYDMTFRGYKSLIRCQDSVIWNTIYRKYWVEVERFSRYAALMVNEPIIAYTFLLKPLKFKNGEDFTLYKPKYNFKYHITMYRFIMRVLITKQGSIGIVTINDIFHRQSGLNSPFLQEDMKYCKKDCTPFTGVLNKRGTVNLTKCCTADDLLKIPVIYETIKSDNSGILTGSDTFRKTLKIDNFVLSF